MPAKQRRCACETSKTLVQCTCECWLKEMCSLGADGGGRPRTSKDERSKVMESEMCFHLTLSFFLSRCACERPPPPPCPSTVMRWPNRLARIWRDAWHAGDTARSRWRFGQLCKQRQKKPTSLTVDFRPNLKKPAVSEGFTFCPFAVTSTRALITAVQIRYSEFRYLLLRPNKRTGVDLFLLFCRGCFIYRLSVKKKQ